MKKTLDNKNGTTYNILAMTETEHGNVYLLNQTTEGGHIIQFVVARNWSDKYKCWDCGQYFMADARVNAEDVYLQTVGALLFGA